MLNAAMKVVGLSVTAFQGTRVTLIQGVLEVTVFPTLNAETIKLVKITSVWILANCLVELVLIVKSTIMLLSADVQEDSLEILSRAAESSPRMKSAKPVEPTQIVKLDPMTPLSVDANKTTLETLSKAVVVNVKAAGTVLQVKNVFNSSVWPSAEKELVVRMPIARPEITGLNVHALKTFWAMQGPDVTLNV